MHLIPFVVYSCNFSEEGPGRREVRHVPCRRPFMITFPHNWGLFYSDMDNSHPKLSTCLNPNSRFPADPLSSRGRARTHPQPSPQARIRTRSLVHRWLCPSLGFPPFREEITSPVSVFQSTSSSMPLQPPKCWLNA